MKSIHLALVFLNWLIDRLHHSSYQTWKPKHSWCQSKFDKWVQGVLLQPVCHHHCDKHSTHLSGGNLLPLPLCLWYKELLHSALALSKFVNEMQILGKVQESLLHPRTFNHSSFYSVPCLCNFSDNIFFSSDARFIKTRVKKKKKKERSILRTEAVSSTTELHVSEEDDIFNRHIWDRCGGSNNAHYQRKLLFLLSILKCCCGPEVGHWKCANVLLQETSILDWASMNLSHAAFPTNLPHSYDAEMHTPVKFP